MEVANTMDYGIPSIRLVAGQSTEASISADLGLPNLKPIKYRRSTIGNTTRVGLNIALRGRPVPSDAGRDAFTRGATGSPAPLPMPMLDYSQEGMSRQGVIWGTRRNQYLVNSLGESSALSGTKAIRPISTRKTSLDGYPCSEGLPRASGSISRPRANRIASLPESTHALPLPGRVKSPEIERARGIYGSMKPAGPAGAGSERRQIIGSCGCRPESENDNEASTVYSRDRRRSPCPVAQPASPGVATCHHHSRVAHSAPTARGTKPINHMIRSHSEPSTGGCKTQNPSCTAVSPENNLTTLLEAGHGSPRLSATKMAPPEHSTAQTQSQRRTSISSLYSELSLDQYDFPTPPQLELNRRYFEPSDNHSSRNVQGPVLFRGGEVVTDRISPPLHLAYGRDGSTTPSSTSSRSSQSFSLLTPVTTGDFCLKTFWPSANDNPSKEDDSPGDYDMDLRFQHGLAGIAGILLSPKEESCFVLPDIPIDALSPIEWGTAI